MKGARSEAERTATSTKKIGTQAKKAVPLFERLKNSAKGLAASVKKSEAEIRSVTATLTKFAAVGAVALGGTVLAAASFESGLTNVAKTTGLAGDELKSLGVDIDALSRKIPTSTSALNEIATVAGQLGIQSADDILKFTETVANLSIVSDFTAGAAAESLARLSNVFQLPINQVDRLASVINELENNTTATAPILASFAQRLAVAAHATGVSAQETLGLAATLVDLGFRAEEAGTAVSKILLEMSADSEKFGALTGKSAKEFRDAMGKDAVATFKEVAKALAQLAPEELAATFEDLSLNGIRVKNVMTALSSRMDLLSKNIGIATKEFEENTSLQKELAVFIKSTANQFKLLTNTLESVAREFGVVLLPAVRFVIQAIKELAELFLSLPGYIKTTVIVVVALGVGLTTLAALFGGLLLALGAVAGAVTFLSTQVALLRAKLIVTAIAGNGLTASLQRIGLAALTAAANITVFQLAIGLLVGGLFAVAAALVIAILKIGDMNRELNEADDQIKSYNANVTSTSKAAREGARTLPLLAKAVKEVGKATKESNLQLLKELGLRKASAEAELLLQKAILDRTKATDEVPTLDFTKQLKAQENQINKTKERIKSITGQMEIVTKTFDVATDAVKTNTLSLKEQEKQFELLSAGTTNFFDDLQALNDIKFSGLLAELTSATELRKALLESGDAPAEVIAAAEVDATNRIIALKTREVEERLGLENRRVTAQAILIKKNIVDEKEAAEALQLLAQESVSNQIKATADLISIRQKAVTDVKNELRDLVKSAKDSRDEIQDFIRDAEQDLLKTQNSLLPVTQQAQKAQTDILRQETAVRRSIASGDFDEAKKELDLFVELEKEASKVRKDAGGFVTEDTVDTTARAVENNKTRIALAKELQAAVASQNISEQVGLKKTLEEQEGQLTSLRSKLAGLDTLSSSINLQTNFDQVVANLNTLQSTIKSLSGTPTPIKVDLDVSEDVVQFFKGDKTISIPIVGLEKLDVVGNAFVSKINQAATQLEAIARSLASQQNFNQESGVIKRAHGGAVHGPGTSTSDSIPARLSNGEFVMRQAAVSKFGLGFFNQLNSLRVPKFAQGGAVGAVPVSQTATDQVNISLNLNKSTFDLRSDRDTALNLVKAFDRLKSGLVGG